MAEIWNGDCGMIVNVKNIRSTRNPSVAYTRTVYVTVGSDTIVIDQGRKITVSKYFSYQNNYMEGSGSAATKIT